MRTRAFSRKYLSIVVATLFVIPACTKNANGTTEGGLATLPQNAIVTEASTPPQTNAEHSEVTQSSSVPAEPTPLKGYALRISGSVQAVQEGSLAFLIPGVLKKLHVRIGERVKRGQVLAELDTADLVLKRDTISLMLKRAELGRDQAKRDLNREKNLNIESATAPVRVEKLTTALESAELGVAEAETQLKIINKSIGDARIIAEYPGVVTESTLEIGEFVSMGKIALRIANTDELEVRLDVPEHLFGSLEIGQELPLTVRTTQKTAKIKIERIVPVVDSRKRSFQVVGSLIGNIDNIIPGQFVEAEIAGREVR